MNNPILKKIKLLIIEDDDTQREELARFFKRRVDKVYLAKNGKEGFDKFETLNPDIVLTDLRMPKMSGLELVETIRKDDRITPIIIFTAMNDREIILESIDKGISNYVIKPINMAALMEVVTDAVKTLAIIDEGKFVTVVSPKEQNMLKNNLSKYFKKLIGKGPSDIRIEITNNMCEIVLIDILTTYEENLIAYDKNISLVNHNRNVLIQDRKFEIEQLIIDDLNMPVKFKKVNTIASSNKLSMEFKLN